MTWKEYYSNFLYWEDDKKIEMLPRITDFPDADQIVDAMQYLPNGESAELLMSMALDAGIRFTVEQIGNMENSTDNESIKGAVSTAVITEDSDKLIADLYGIYSDEIIREIIIKALEKKRRFTSKQIVKLIKQINDYETNSLLIDWALDNDLSFTLKQITESEDYLDTETFSRFEDSAWIDSEDVDEIISEVSNNSSSEMTSKLIDRALDEGVPFTPEQVSDIIDYADDNQLKQILSSVDVSNPRELIELFDDIDNDDIIGKLTNDALKQGIKFTPEQISEFVERVDSSTGKTLAKTASINKVGEIMDVLKEIDDDDVIRELTKNALNKGLRFTPGQILKLDNYLDTELMSRLVDTSSMAFSKKQLAEIEYSIDSSTYDKALARASGKSSLSKETGFFASLFNDLGFGSSSASKKTQNSSRGRRCDGDCAHCPPHYGYRYGRWYYGHHHTHGCEFHGNKEGDLSD